MAKIRLTKLLSEAIEKRVERERVEKQMDSYVKKMDESLHKLRALMIRDGYKVPPIKRG
jgi:hypothetical protein